MILFILIAIGIALYTIFADGWLIDTLKHDVRRYENGYDYREASKYIFVWFVFNILSNIINCLIIFAISIVTVSFCPKAESYYTFNINSLKDNLVTSGEIHDGGFCMRGTIDGEISYFFSRTTDKRETIGHIPADKSYIKYDDNKKPCIEVHQKNHKIPEIVEKLLFTKWCNEKSVDYYIIIVPNGTISTTETYEIDME